MKIKLPFILLAALALTTAGCHARKAAGTKQQVNKDVSVPPTTAQLQDTTHRTPTPQFTPNPIVIPNTRPKPVPDPQVPVPPM